MKNNRTLTVKYGTWERLTKLKMQLSHNSIDQTIDYLLYELELVEGLK